MNYFLLRQDKRVEHYPKLKNQLPVSEIWNSKTPLFLESVPCHDATAYMALHFFEHPCFAISPELKRLFESYQEGAEFRGFVTLDVHGKGIAYFFYRPLLLDCMDSRSEFHPNKMIKKLILNQSRIGPHKIFQVDGLLERHLIVDLEILELMLCGDFYPFDYELLVTL